MDNDQRNGDQQIQQIERGTDIVPKNLCRGFGSGFLFFHVQISFLFVL